MKSIIIAAIMCLGFSAPALAQSLYSEINKTATVTTLLDLQSVRQDNMSKQARDRTVLRGTPATHATAWMHQVYKKPMVDEGKSFNLVKTLLEFDCNGERLHTKNVVAMLNKKIVESATPAQLAKMQWTQISPGTGGEKMLNIACGTAQGQAELGDEFLSGLAALAEAQKAQTAAEDKKYQAYLRTPAGRQEHAKEEAARAKEEAARTERLRQADALRASQLRDMHKYDHTTVDGVEMERIDVVRRCGVGLQGVIMAGRCLEPAPSQ
jgi:hypothetical protein